MDIRHRTIDTGEVRLHVAEAGEGPLVVLLHGFPELWYAWKHQIPALVQAGFKVVAPDQRGYNLSDKPPRVRDYHVERLAADVVGLLDAYGVERAHLVGHDWGGAMTWITAGLYPERFDRLAVLNCPHPARLLRGFTTLRQLKKSWYIFYFQLPYLPERAWAQKDWKPLRNLLRREPRRPGAFSEADIEQYVRALSRPGAVGAAISWYRAAMRHAAFDARRVLRPVPHPTRVIWGVHDAALGQELADPGRWAPNAEVHFVEDASHWVQWDAPERVNALLVEWLSPRAPA